MVYCTNCGTQNTRRLEDNNGEPYQLEDNLNDWGDYCKGEHNIVTYTTYVCNECGNLFALGTLDPRAKFPKSKGVSISVTLDIPDIDKLVKEKIDELLSTDKSNA